MKFYMWGAILNNKVKILVASLVIGLPLMLGFQNCAKTQNFEMSDVATESNKASSIGSDDLPSNETVDLEQPGSLPETVPDSNTGLGETSPDSPGVKEKEDNQDVAYQVEDPDKEDAKDIEEAKYSCSHLGEANSDESNNDNSKASFSNDSVSGLRGKVVLSADDFGGNTEINSISNSYGKIILCGLHVKTVTDSGGKYILIKTTVDSFEKFHGKVHVVEEKN